MTSRKFLFLQGVATPFFRKLGEAIQENGYEVFRVNFCGGDRWFSPSKNTWRFSATLEQLPAWLEEKHQQHRFTDVILFGDTRPIHLQALPLFKRLGLSIHVYEEGYFRPDWITLEQNGVNGHSRLLCKDPAFWQQQPVEKLKTAHPIGKNFLPRAWHDACYRLANASFSPAYPHYQTHRPFKAYREYLGWAQRMPTNKLWREHWEKTKIQRLIASNRAYYLLPLQLDSDAQIRVHSPFVSVQQMIVTVMASFAKFAPADSVLVIKNHPLDTGLLKHSKKVRQVAKTLNISERVLFLETGHLPTLLQHTKGTVLVNSTTGTSALHHGSPTIALGTALFDIPGLTFQEGLDRFWQEGRPADQALFSQFRQRVIQETQINGDFYSYKGIQLAIAGSLAAMQITPQTPKTAPILTPIPTPIVAPAKLIYGGKLPETSYLYKER
ncbi:capsular polysaccharide export protein [Thiothrix eikelboomii]|uniref:Capsular polysaccharide export protein n=1 Tax=Thiothrix eikelboomii TaxID=92487 RepID=A0A1T4X2Q2_9GAMM|nr:capsular biosynthesis protein [Thiothrix eikelboomii]SKA83874.1 capsular polysaccharide export protein [Thiothrix eikelboomii]